MRLVKNQAYRGTLRLGLIESVAPNETVAAKLRAAGFVDVTVSGTGRVRTARGKWAGETGDVALPSQVEHIAAI